MLYNKENLLYQPKKMDENMKLYILQKDFLAHPKAIFELLQHSRHYKIKECFK